MMNCHHIHQYNPVPQQFDTFYHFKLISNIRYMSLIVAEKVRNRETHSGRQSRRRIPCFSDDYILFRPCCREKEEDQASATEYEFYICNAAKSYLHVTASLSWHWTLKICLCAAADFYEIQSLGLMLNVTVVIYCILLQLIHFTALELDNIYNSPFSIRHCLVKTCLDILYNYHS